MVTPMPATGAGDAARKRAAEERQKRLAQALEQLAQVEKQKNLKRWLAKKRIETEGTTTKSAASLGHRAPMPRRG